MKIINPIRLLKHLIISERHLKRIRKAFESQLYDDCITECNELLIYNSTDFHGYYYKGLCLTELKIFDEALNCFDLAGKCIQRNKARSFLKDYSCDIVLRKSAVYLKMREFEKAKELLQENIAQNPGCVSSYTKLASIEGDEENYLEAIEIIHQGIIANPNNKTLEDEKNWLIYNYTENQKIIAQNK